MRPGSSSYQERLQRLPLVEDAFLGDVRTRYSTAGPWRLGGQCSAVPTTLPPCIADIHIKRQQAEHIRPASVYLEMDYLPGIVSDSSLLFPTDQDDKKHLRMFHGSFSLHLPKTSSYPLGLSFLKSITGKSCRQRYLKLLDLLSTDALHVTKALVNHTSSASPSAALDPPQSTQLVLSTHRAILRPIVCRELLTDVVRLLACSASDVVTLSSLERSARWFLTAAPHSIWFSDRNGLSTGVHICRKAIKCKSTCSPPVSFLCSYFKASNLPLDTSVEKISSPTISTGHLRLGLELYLLLYRYYLIRKTLFFASAHSLNTELQSLAVRTNAREIYSQLANVSADIQALWTQKTTLQNFRESLPVSATRMNQRIQLLKMALNDASMKILRHQKKHGQSKEYWRTKSAELEQSAMRQRKVQQDLQDQIQRLEQRVKSSTLAKTRVSRGAEKIQSSVDKLNNKMAAKKEELEGLNKQIKELNQTLTDKEWQITTAQSVRKRELEANSLALHTELNRLDVLLSASFFENKPANLHSIIANMQLYISRITKTKDINLTLPELGALEEQILAIHKTGFIQLLSDSISAMQRINYKFPPKFLGLMAATCISLQQRTALLKELCAFLGKAQPHLMACCTAVSAARTSKPSAPLSSNPDVSVIITSTSIQPKLCFQHHSDDATTSSFCGNSEEDTGPQGSSSTKEASEGASQAKEPELCSLLGSPIPWNLLHYRYSTSLTLEQNLLQYLRQTCALNPCIARSHHYKQTLKPSLADESINKKSDECCEKSSTPHPSTPVE